MTKIGGFVEATGTVKVFADCSFEYSEVVAFCLDVGEAVFL